jgi:hypothetical protein
VSEPGLLRLAAGDPVADALIERGEHLYRMGGAIPPRDFLRVFRAGVHSTHATPEELPAWLDQGARRAARERPPWEAEVPVSELAAAAFPKLVISGGHSSVFEAVSDTLADQIGAGRAIVPGRGHTIPAVGEAYNSRVHEFLSWAEASAR